MPPGLPGLCDKTSPMADQNQPKTNETSASRQAPSRGPPWDLTSEKIWTVVNGERQIIFWSHFNYAINDTYDVCQLKLLKQQPVKKRN